MSALFTAHASLLFGSALALVGIMSSLLASRFGVPILLVFLGVGILAGENGLGVHFENYQLTYMVGSGALAIILFDGGLRTRMATVRAVLAPAGALASAGVVITAGLTGVVAAVLLRLGWVEGLLVGAIVASTDAAVVFFLLRTGGLQLRRRVGGVLEVESGANDPFAVLLTVMLVTVLSGASFAPGALVLRVLEEGSLGLIIGLAGGFGLVGLINRVSLPSGLHPAFVVTAALVIFALTQTLGASGFLAAYVAGLVFGNRPVRAYGAVISFHDTATWLCQIVLFTLLGLLVTPSHVMPIVLPAVAVAAFLIAIGRPVAVFACLSPFRYSRAEMAFVSWVGLRGGVSIFLATIPLLVGLPRGELFFNVAFVVVVVSLIVQGWTISFAARRAGVALRDPAPEVKRIDIDLPGQLHEELVGYPVRDPSPATRHRALPSWVKPVLVVRGGKVLDPLEAGNLRSGDYGYFLAPTPRIPRLDRFFAVDGTVSDRDTIPEFPFDASLTAGAVADLYGLTIEEGERAMSIADLFADRLDGAPQEGDRLDFGDAMLVAHGVVADRVHLAGLLLEATAEDEEPPPATWSEAAGRRARKQWRRLRQRARRPAA